MSYETKKAALSLRALSDGIFLHRIDNVLTIRSFTSGLLLFILFYSGLMRICQAVEIAHLS